MNLKLTDKDVQEAGRLYESGLTLKAVADRMGVHERTIRLRFIKAGIARRPAHRHSRVVDRVCPECGRSFQIPLWMHRQGWRRCCSRACSTANYRGPAHHNWKGDQITREAGHLRARNLFPLTELCEHEGCDQSPVERHHVDGHSWNNDPSNVRCLCRRHHMEEDGRLAYLRSPDHPRHRRSPTMVWRKFVMVEDPAPSGE